LPFEFLTFGATMPRHHASTKPKVNSSNHE
jgi:hypothetical protein